MVPGAIKARKTAKKAEAPLRGWTVGLVPFRSGKM
jgi:hypothetical protein